MAGIPETEQSTNVDTGSMSETSVTKTNVAQLGALLRDKGDAVNPQLAVMDKVSTYEGFAQFADAMTTNQGTSVRAIAAVFGATLKAVRYVGKTGEVAGQIKENALTYLENKFASYIIGNGGWDSVWEESSSDID